MNTTLTRKFLFLGLLLSMFLLLARMKPWTVSPASPVNAAPAPAPLQPRLAVIHQTPVKSLVKKMAASKPIMELNRALLRSYARDYNIIFSGQIRCGEDPCAAHLDLVINTTRNANLRKAIETSEDGNYWFQVPLQELPREQMSWVFTARTAQGLSDEVRGHQILVEDSVVPIPNTLHLK